MKDERDVEAFLSRQPAVETEQHRIRERIRSLSGR